MNAPKMKSSRAARVAHAAFGAALIVLAPSVRAADTSADTHETGSSGYSAPQPMQDNGYVTRQEFQQFEQSILYRIQKDEALESPAAPLPEFGVGEANGEYHPNPHLH